jgi:cell division control protein 45
LRFCLFRHWNLYDAMFHSGYLGVKMKLWTMEGRTSRTTRTTTICQRVTLDPVSIRAYRLAATRPELTTYAHMSSDLKESLFPMLSEQRASYGLWDLSYPSLKGDPRPR